MKDWWSVIVIGGGASGMMAAITAAKSGKDVLILERNDKLGKKILQTGNGRCNLTNYKMDSSCYCRENADFAMKIIHDFDEKAVMDFFSKAGLLLHNRQGYVYPNTDQASSVNEILGLMVKRSNIAVSYETTAKKIIKKDNFLIQTSKGEFHCNKLILATGGKAYPKSGSDGSGYLLSESLGHRIITPLPALTSLSVGFKGQKKISGVRCDGVVTLLSNGKILGSERGEIQMTDYGISGIPVFQISRYGVQALYQKQKVTCEIDFLPDYDEKDILQMLFTRFQIPGQTAGESFCGLIHKKISDMLLKEAGIIAEQKTTKTDKNRLYGLASLIKHFTFEITDYHGFDFGQVCQGGVAVDEINPATMESKLVSDLYFCGELVDVDGICGGYNLQWAWSSGYLAGRAVGND